MGHKRSARLISLDINRVREVGNIVLRSGSHRARHRVLIVREFLVLEESAGEAAPTSSECASDW
jgi:hypothetical protein